jgi:NDP-sugar pyrophosphorylase family protein
MATPLRPRSALAGLSTAILVGGRGTRLRPVVSDRPKALAPVAGRPFLSYWLEALEQQGFRDVVLCAGYQASQLQETFGSRHGGLTLTHSVEARPLGTGGALRHALRLFRSDPVLVLNGDSFCVVDLQAFFREHMECGARASLVLTQVPDTGRFGRVECQPDGHVQAFREKSDDAGPGWINAGIYLIRRELLADLPDNQEASLERDLLPTWGGGRLHGFRCRGKFIDIGTPESLSQAARFFTEVNRAAA